MARLEDRYVVLKIEDLERLDSYEQNALKTLMTKVGSKRNAAGKPPSQPYLVIGKDWPEYNLTLNHLMIRLEREELEDKLMSLTNTWLTSPKLGGEFMLIGAKGCFQVIRRASAGDVAGISPLNEEWKVVLKDIVIRDEDGSQRPSD